MRRYRHAVVLALDNQGPINMTREASRPFRILVTGEQCDFICDRAVIRIDGVILSAQAFEQASKLAWQGNSKTHPASVPAVFRVQSATTHASRRSKIGEKNLQNMTLLC